MGRISRITFAWLCVFLCSFSLLVMASASAPLVTEEEETIAETESVPPTTTCEASESSTRTVSPVDPSDASGFKAVLLGLFGSYDTVITEYRYTNNNGYTSVSIDIQEDWPWIISACVFALVIFCLFRFLGGIFNAKR